MINRNAAIISTAMAVPEKIVPNQYFNELLGEDVSTWLVENLTNRERRWLAEDESVADLCEQAARTASPAIPWAARLRSPSP